MFRVFPEVFERGSIACIPSFRTRKTPTPHDEHFYRKRNFVECITARLKDIQRISMRYD